MERVIVPLLLYLLRLTLVCLLAHLEPTWVNTERYIVILWSRDVTVV